MFFMNFFRIIYLLIIYLRLKSYLNVLDLCWINFLVLTWTHINLNYQYRLLTYNKFLGPPNDWCDSIYVSEFPKVHSIFINQWLSENIAPERFRLYFASCNGNCMSIDELQLSHVCLHTFYSQVTILIHEPFLK